MLLHIRSIVTLNISISYKTSYYTFFQIFPFWNKVMRKYNRPWQSLQQTTSEIQLFWQEKQCFQRVFCFIGFYLLWNNSEFSKFKAFSFLSRIHLWNGTNIIGTFSTTLQFYYSPFFCSTVSVFNVHRGVNETRNVLERRKKGSKTWWILNWR